MILFVTFSIVMGVGSLRVLPPSLAHPGAVC